MESAGQERLASAIERWATSISGLEADPQFLEALERNVQKAIATGTRLEIIRSKYLLDAMRARVDIAKAKDALPFAGFGQPQVEYEGDDLVEFAPLILAWDDAR